jgi:diguanylate cyclase (GGDEF)-like protein
MASPNPSFQRSKIAVRIAVAGMSLAVVALGALAVWAAIVSQNGADGLSQAGLQTSGHLRAIQALTLIDTQTDSLEKGTNRADLQKVRRAQRLLDDALDRMAAGEIRDAARLAEAGRPIVLKLKPAIEQFLANPPGFDSNGASGPEAKMEAIIAELQTLLNVSDPDPSQLLAEKLDAVSDTERTVRRTAFVLIPLGLGGVSVCGWLLSLYRRRSVATMRDALEVTAHEARTDQLTGLRNRRALIEELDSRSDAGDHFTLALADLNGFKRYNDTFGHPAGDALLRRLGHQLADACEGRGVAARLGGDEFCVVFAGDVPADEMHDLLGAALSADGGGFTVTAASGAVAVPREARNPSAALRLADSRMYARKFSPRQIAEGALPGAMMLMLDEHHPGLGSHVEEVASLARACADELGLSAEEAGLVEDAAQLHDLGKVAIPSAILTKQGPLDEEEWDFMRRHSIIGERIVAGVPSLEGLAPVIRASHERWDGDGYPDGLARDEIPIGARIIFVADAFCAMTEERSYAAAKPVESARQELRGCAGTQFDPAVVLAFLAVLDSRGAQAAVHSGPPLLVQF